jgi:hypothetical protein
LAALLDTIRSGALGSGILSVEVSLYGGGSSPRASPANQDMLVKCKIVRSCERRNLLPVYHVQNHDIQKNIIVKFPPKDVFSTLK